MNELCLAINPALFPLKLGLERQIEIAFRKIDAIGYLQASIFCTIKLKRREKKNPTTSRQMHARGRSECAHIIDKLSEKR